MGQVVWIEATRSEQCSHLGLKEPIVCLNCGGARERRRIARAMLREPVADTSDHLTRIVAMSLDVLPTDIGQDGVVAMAFRIENQRSFSAMAILLTRTSAPSVLSSAQRG